MMIHDDQVGFLRALVHARQKTGIKRGTILARAGFPSRVQLPPKLRIIRQKSQLRAVSGFRQFRPILDLPEGIQFLHAPQQCLIGDLMELCQAKKIRASFHHCHFQIRRKVFL